MYLLSTNHLIIYRNNELNGNSSKKVLQKLDNLEENVPSDLKPYVLALRAFDAVRVSCFGQKLEESYQMDIENFKKIYMDLEIGMIPKSHILFEHVVELCERTGVGLGYWSEQARQVSILFKNPILKVFQFLVILYTLKRLI